MNSTQEHINDITEQNLDEILSERYLSYALSTIMSRSLPDVRDGMKPVHRRLMYAMYKLNLNPKTSPKKSARVVGDVIGKYHPHGDSAVYEAMVRLAQDFAVRYPLVDGQGNFGNIDGDNPAAMRYTEARLTDVALLLLEGIDENAVDFRDTYDGSESEPIVLPGGFPNMLANGASGIAVGMATNIPPHNVYELCSAMELMLDKDPSVSELMEHIKGPDFPTGGVLTENRQTIETAYASGKGSFRVRAKWYKEELKQGQYQIIVNEIPYQVQKAKLVEKIADLLHLRKLPMIDDIRDESTEDVRLVIVPKSRNVAPELIMEALFRNTDLESRFSMNLNVLDKGIVPGVMGIKQALRCWLEHRQEVLLRRSYFRLDKINHRIEVLEGYLVVYLNIDEVIRIIREEDEPKQELIRTFSLTDVQAEAVLNMRLRNLRKLEEMEIKTERDNLLKERDKLNKLVNSETLQWKEIRKEVVRLKEMFGTDTPLGKRRTVISDPLPVIDGDILETAMIEKEPITVVCSAKGWIKAMKGHGVNTAEIKYKEGDREKFIIEVQTTDKLLVFCTNGRFYTLGCDKLPPGRGFGEPLRIMLDIPNDSEITEIITFKPDIKILLASSDGRGFIVKSDDLLAQTKQGKQVLNVSGKVKASICYPINENDDYVATIGQNRKLLVFPMDEIPEMSRGKGVILQKYKDGGMSDLKTFNMENGLRFKYGNGEKTITDLLGWLGKRASAGKMVPNGFPRNNKF